MSTRKTQNSFLILTTLGVYLGIILCGGASNGHAQDGVVINKRPLKDFGSYVQEKVESKSVDLDAPFLVEFSGNLNKSGKIDVATAKYTKTEGTKEVVDIIKKAIESVNDSGYFGYLRQLDNSPDGKLTVRAEQGESGFSAIVNLETLNEKWAKTMASGLGTMIPLAKQQLESQGSTDKDELLLINSLTISSEGKSIIVNMSLPKSSFREMIERRLVEPKKTPQS